MSTASSSRAVERGRLKSRASISINSICVLLSLRQKRFPLQIAAHQGQVAAIDLRAPVLTDGPRAPLAVFTRRPRR